jgi:hypothetical protein
MGLKRLRAWFDYCAARGQTLDPSADTNLDLLIWIKRLDDLARFAKSNNNKTLGDVPKLLPGPTPQCSGTYDGVDGLEHD